VPQTAQSSPVLSSEWQQLQDNAGRPYYYNTQTGVSSWQGPDATTQYSTNGETVTAVTDETAAVNTDHQQHFDTEVSAAASSAQYESTASTTAHSTDYTVELGQLREAVAHIALSQETAEQLMKQHIADAIAALKSDFNQQMNAATAASQTQLSAEVSQLQAELTATAAACTAATQALQADVTAVNEHLQQQQQHDASATTAHSLAALQSSLNDRAARAEAVAKALAVQSLKYAREQRDHVMTAVQTLESELQAVRSSCSTVSEAAVLQCAAAAVDSKLASSEAAALSAVSAQSGRSSAGSYSGTSPASNLNPDFYSPASAATATTAGVDHTTGGNSVSVSALAQEQSRLRELLKEQDARFSKDIADARSRLSSFLDVYCTAQVTM
jgi:WW domain